MKSFSQLVSVSTETGTIAFFEPDRVPFEDYFADEPFTYLTYMKEGKLLLLSIGGDGVVVIAVEIVDSLPGDRSEAVEGRLEVKSGRIYFGPGESLPQNDEEFEEKPDRGDWLSIPAGKYHYVLSMIEGDPNGASIRLALTAVSSFDGVPYCKDGEMPSLEG